MSQKKSTTKTGQKRAKGAKRRGAPKTAGGSAGAAPAAVVPAAFRHLHAELVRAHHFYNRKWWGGRLLMPIFGFHPNPNGKQILGHYKAGAWVLDEGQQVKEADEIVFYADLCLGAGIKEIIHTLLHEMIHQWQANHGNPPKGRKNYHNREFHHEVRRVGLLSDFNDEAGHTHDGPGFLASLKELKPTKSAIPYRKGPARKALAGTATGKEDGEGEGGEDGGKEKTEKVVTWRCHCGYAVRVAVAYFDATCNICKKPYKRVKDLDEKNPEDQGYFKQPKRGAGAQ
jgi:hypothetical protein